MDHREYDVLVIGSGLAGLSAAEAAAEAGSSLRVGLLTTGSESSYSGCSWKTHGVNAAMNLGDSAGDHALDTFNGGGKIGNPELATLLAKEIPSVIRELERRGVAFDKEEDGSYAAGYYGGSTRPRSIHARDMAGRQIVNALVDQISIKGVHVLCNRHAVGLVMSGNGCGGAYVFNAATNSVEVHSAHATILATGGGACVWPISTITHDKNAAGFSMGLEAGASLVDMEMIQFHPSGVYRPGKFGHGEIMEEELRSMGAHFLNKDGERFMLKYDPRGERATRDIVARGSYIEIKSGAGHEGGILFDLSSIDRVQLAERFPFMIQRLRSVGVDILKDSKVVVSPAAHFVMGGLEIGPTAQTTIPRLYACGEDAGGIHGGNRLGGNGVADALVFGRIAGRHAATVSPSQRHYSQKEEVLISSDSEAIDLDPAGTDLSRLMWDSVGPVRQGRDLREAEQLIENFWDSAGNSPKRVPVREFNARYLERRVAYQKLMFATMVVKSAVERTNSVGAHYRLDSDGDNSIYNVVIHRDGSGFPKAVRRLGSGTMDGALMPEIAA